MIKGKDHLRKFWMCLHTSGSWRRSEFIKNYKLGGTWVAQSTERITLAQVMISQFMGLNPMSGSELLAQSLEPAACFRFCVFLSLFAPTFLVLSLSLKNKYINIKKKEF